MVVVTVVEQRQCRAGAVVMEEETQFKYLNKLNCEAGEDNNNSCNKHKHSQKWCCENGNGGGNQVQVSKQNSTARRRG